MRVCWLIGLLCWLGSGFAQSVPLTYPLTSHARQLLADLPNQSEVLSTWPSDDELWLHHDASHLLAMEVDINRSIDWPHLFATLDREFQAYAIYRLYKPYYLIIMSRATSIPWPRHMAWAARFVADQALLTELFALHQVRIHQINLNRVGRTLPLHLLYLKLRHNLLSVWQPPVVGKNRDWQRLNLAVSLADPALLLSTSTELIGPYWPHYSWLHQQYVLGMAMMANAMVRQYPSCLLLWDKYSPGVYRSHRPSIDMLLLRNFCIHQSNRLPIKKPATKGHGPPKLERGLRKRVA